jgi:hypothetical protein
VRVRHERDGTLFDVEKYVKDHDGYKQYSAPEWEPRKARRSNFYSLAEERRHIHCFIYRLYYRVERNPALSYNFTRTAPM